ncbi:amidohydrolase family protein [Novosphingobium album (ex Hu et al. 2023)]|uniref:Amidohydrolase family protein n=1 Tax=Novosphingobium album (ex Hu et al. 2023) TaxID=2930093 RepID=A0ABT0AYA9_9SPHN|nr:amidohydrolase family protein [Novosphingobium album (ex Hu et al. 2023)]MCJ2177788.1 amidohydrolase family protein [Novosphingobium album (ex Hu et al. 2023)]
MTITFTNARVFDGTSMLPGTHTVALEGNRIVSIAAGNAAPGTEVIDLGGKTLMPGLITCHFHPDFYKFTLAEGLAGDPLGKEFPPGVMMAMAIRNGRVLLESGFTGYVGASCSNDVDAQLKIAIAEGIVEGPRLRACSPHIGTTGDLNDRKRWWRKQVTPGTDVFFDGPEDMRKIVREYTRRGAQTIKIFASQGHGFPNRVSRNMDRDEIEMIVRTAHGRGAKVRAHVADKAMIMECIELGVDIIDHGDEVDAEVIAAMVDKGTFWVPSVVYLQCLLQLGWGDARMQELYEHVLETLPAAQAAGVRILVGDDYSGVFRDMIEDDPLDHQVGNYGREFATYAAVPGLSAEQVLSWGTKNAGEALLDGETSLGVIAADALADLIVVDGDPVTDPAVLARPQEALKAVIRDGAFTIDRLPPEARRIAGTEQGIRAA